MLGCLLVDVRVTTVGMLGDGRSISFKSPMPYTNEPPPTTQKKLTNHSEDKAREVLGATDLNGDGVISYEEFKVRARLYAFGVFIGGCRLIFMVVVSGWVAGWVGGV